MGRAKDPAPTKMCAEVSALFQAKLDAEGGNRSALERRSGVKRDRLVDLFNVEVAWTLTEIEQVAGAYGMTVELALRESQGIATVTTLRQSQKSAASAKLRRVARENQGEVTGDDGDGHS